MISPRWLVLHLFTIAVAVTFCWLGWWQLSRYEWGGGNLQNLGYALQWPLFAGFVIFFWWRLVHDPHLLHGQPEPDADHPAGTSPVEPDEATTTTARAEGRPRPAGGPPAAPSRYAPRVRVHRNRQPAPQRRADDLPTDAFDDAQAAYNRYLGSLHAERSGSDGFDSGDSGDSEPHPHPKEAHR